MIRVYQYKPPGAVVYMVAAKNQKEAIQLLGITPYKMHKYSIMPSSQDHITIAMAEPGVIFAKQIDQFLGMWEPSTQPVQ